MKEWMLTEAEGYDLVAKYGIPSPKYKIVNSAEDAGDAAETIGFPVVMKIVSPDIIHKSDAGGVVTSVSSKEEAQSAYNRIVASAKKYNEKATITGIIVEEQAQPGLELIIGGKTDPTFGKVLTFGMGGTLVELNKDVTLRILPITQADAEEMVKEINGYPLISGYRGSKPRDEKGLVKIILGAAKMFEENDSVREFDINPVRLYEKGSCAVDCRIIMSDEKPPVFEKHVDVPIEYFNPRSVAVIGASQDSTKMGYAVMHNLLHFPGQLYPVNNKRDEIQGLKAYRSNS